ncbi:hypothetical protein Pla108_22700 [Botrimarina colliarenosi]|uniref:Uncharacterized protein n=1 Tax=Botrimarina colliarenosi TaxID=2528001 RepID=A0A5C6AIQ1_9BACT|nr:hypothetical protein [Botrimarina colliarenosi]TWT98113.1 hypothetical protein Pla108_22700 [Botrimarina colliarenosi]
MSTPTAEQAATHVVRCLRLNPMWQSDEVLASWAALHHVAPDQANSYQAALDEAARKSAQREKLNQLREKVWKAPLEELRRRLDRLPQFADPELAEIARRLRVIVEARNSLPQLTQHRDFDGDFFECFKQVLTGGVKQSAAMRERVAASCEDPVLRKRTKKMTKLLRREAPELTSLESDWFTLLNRQKHRSVAHERAGNRDSLNESWWWPSWWIVWLLFVAPPLGFLVWIVSSIVRLSRYWRGAS